jgi:exopolysaccharide biosynthesis polyprenyl glycosylphosphotransferase
MLRRFSINFAAFSMAVDLIAVGLSLWIAVVVRPFLNNWLFFEFVPPPVRIHISVYAIFPLLYLLILGAFSIYDGRKYLRVTDEFAALTLAFLIASVSAAGILYLSFRDVSRALFLLFLIFAYVSLLSWRGLIRFYFRVRKNRPDVSHRVLIVGAGPLGQKVQAQLTGSRADNLVLVGFLDDSLSTTAQQGELLGGRDDVRKVVGTFNITDVVIALPHSVYQHLSDVVAALDDLPVRIWVALGFFDLALYRTGIEDFAGIPMLDLRAPALSDYQRLIKRSFDLFLGSIALVLSLPFMGLAALAIWIEDGRPILFVQKRVGENGRLFDVCKFRTMVKNAEQLRDLVEHVDENGNQVHKIRNDPRVTRVGRFLRRTSLDELPQLYNVLRGEMSLVGPRPELPYLVEKYQPWQRKRWAVPPGITGWWQVTGRSDKLMHLHTEDDLHYINNYSIWLDIQILIRTAWVVLIERGSY